MDEVTFSIAESALHCYITESAALRITAARWRLALLSTHRPDDCLRAALPCTKQKMHSRKLHSRKTSSRNR